jgi:hypothetical protein
MLKHRCMLELSIFYLFLFKMTLFFFEEKDESLAFKC